MPPSPSPSLSSTPAFLCQERDKFYFTWGRMVTLGGRLKGKIRTQLPDAWRTILWLLQVMAQCIMSPSPDVPKFDAPPPTSIPPTLPFLSN